MSTATAHDVARVTRASYVESARALVALSWARTMTPLLSVSIIGLVVLPMLFGLVFRARMAAGMLPDGDLTTFLVSRFDQLVCGLAAPLIGLLLGTSAFSAEADDGTLLYLVTTTTPRWWIVTVRVLFAAVTTASLAVIAVIGTAWIAAGAGPVVTRDPQHVTTAFAVAGAYAGATYAAFCTLLSLVTRRALVTGLAYVLFWEGLLSATFPGLKYLSVRQWTLAIAGRLTDAGGARLEAGPGVAVAVVGALVVLGLAVVVGERRVAGRVSRGTA